MCQYACAEIFDDRASGSMESWTKARRNIFHLHNNLTRVKIHWFIYLRFFNSFKNIFFDDKHGRGIIKDRRFTIYPAERRLNWSPNGGGGSVTRLQHRQSLATRFSPALPHSVTCFRAGGSKGEGKVAKEEAKGGGGGRYSPHGGLPEAPKLGCWQGARQ